jgi:hypothetical protein
MSSKDDHEKRREESPEWHRARAKILRKAGFTKMAEEHEQIAENKDTTRRRGRATLGRAAPTPGQRGDDGYPGMPPRSNVDASPDARTLPSGG